MPMSGNEVRDLVGDVLMPLHLAGKSHLDRIDKWYRWEHEAPHRPKRATQEYKELASRAVTPWLGLVVTAVAQALYVEGYRRARDPENAEGWRYWQANGLDSRQIAVHRAALAYGLSYVTVLPGQMFDGSPMPRLRGVSPRQMTAVYEDPAEDDLPVYAIRAEGAKVQGSLGYNVRVYDGDAVYRLIADASGGVEYVDYEVHEFGFCPVVRFANMLDLEGRTPGEVEPFIPLAGRIDQTTFDRLVVQRFASWVVRTIAGMSEPDDPSEAAAKKMRLLVEDLLVADDPDTKFGSLPATPLDGFIEARDADIRDLAAVTQTPPHHLLGQMANLSAEALAAAEAGLTRKVEERKHAFGESWEQVFRLAAYAAGDYDGATDTEAQVRWRDTESRSLAQTADALGKLAQMLGVPVEMLWEKIPGWTDQDVERAKSLRDESDVLGQLLGDLTRGATSAPVDDDEAAA